MFACTSRSVESSYRWHITTSVSINSDLANEECETELIKQVRQGTYNALLPETLADLENVIDTVIVKKTNLPRILLNSFLQLRLVLLEEQKKGNYKLDFFYI